LESALNRTNIDGLGHEADTTGALKKIETTFKVLVAERGVFDAVRIIVGLLFEAEKDHE
jgi:hypothetical protein